MEGDRPKDMETMVDKLEAMFRKTDSDVEYMCRKLENEFQETTEGKDQILPLELKRRLEQVKHDYQSILVEAENVKRAQKDMEARVKQQLQSAAQVIQRLQLTSGAKLPDVAEQEKLVGLILGSPEQLSSFIQNGTHPQSETKSSVEEQDKNLSPTVTTLELGPSMAELRAQSDDIIPITEEEFKSVSSSIRRMETIDDVNRVYRRLYEFFKTEGNKTTLSVTEMIKMRMKITGATGEAKLKTLKALKIIDVTRTGAVKLL